MGDQEVRVRVEEGAKVGSAINRLQDALDGEVAERQQSHSDCIDRIRIVSENLTEIRQMLSNFRGEAMSEKEERIEDVSALRMLLQNIDQKVMVQLRECKVGLENEMGERIT